MYSITINNNPLRVDLKTPIIQASESLPDTYCYPILSQTTSYRTGDEKSQIDNLGEGI